MPKLYGLVERINKVVRIDNDDGKPWTIIEKEDGSTAIMGFLLVGGEGADMVVVTVRGKEWVEVPVAWARLGYMLPRPIVLMKDWEARFELVTIRQDGSDVTQLHFYHDRGSLEFHVSLLLSRKVEPVGGDALADLEAPLGKAR